MQMITIDTWANFKLLLRNKLLPMSYDSVEDFYDLFLPDGIIMWHYNILKDGGADQVEFETYYKDIKYSVRKAYSASILGLVPASSATDVFTLTGSATQVVKILRARISGTKTTGGINDVVFLGRSSANSGGASTSPTIVRYDAGTTAATATVKAYTSNPSPLGALVGNYSACKIPFGATTITTNPIFEWIPLIPVILDGTSEVFSVNLNGVTLTGGNLDINIEWTEE